MEAKVDVRKLQILNDRINQTIDALNQVRLSVHGLGQGGMQNPFVGQGYGMQHSMGVQNPYLFGTQTPFQGVGGQLGQLHSQIGQQGLPGMSTGQGFQQGFQHSPFQNPFQNPFVNPYTLQNPYATQGATNPWVQGSQLPFTGTPWTGLGGVAGGFGGGLFHSSQEVIERQLAEVRASDPQRITQTFPFVSY